MMRGALPLSTYRDVFFNQREELDGFLSTIFKQLDVKEFRANTEPFLDEGAANERDFYTLMLDSACPRSKGGKISNLSNILRSLKEERETLAANVAAVTSPCEVKGNYMEIGFPGRMIRPLTKLMGLTGVRTVVNTAEKLSDYAQCGFPRPYHQFVPLSDYRELDSRLQLGGIGHDVISCFIGLHHCPEERLDSFVKSIERSLNPGGIFLLRDHDAGSEEMKRLAAVVHSVFNAGTGVSFEEEIIEERNFQPLEYWDALLEKRGLVRTSDPLVREGDPTKNALVKYLKPDPSRPELATHEWMISRMEKYVRPRHQTHLTLIEWYNVESSQALGEFAKRDRFYNYPYFGDTVELWKTLMKSVSAANGVMPLYRVLSSEYMGMSAFIATAMTVEYLSKAILYLPLRLAASTAALLPAREEKPDDPWQRPAKVYGEWLAEFGSSLEETPFYASHYLRHIPRFWRSLSDSWREARNDRSASDLLLDRQTLLNATTGVVMSIDLFARALFSTPVNWMMGGEEMGDQRVIGAIVASENSSLEGVDGRIKTIFADSKNSFVGIEVPRYSQLTELLQKLASQGIPIVEIAGQKQIQIEVLLSDGAGEEFYTSLGGVTLLHKRRALHGPQEAIAALQVDIAELHKILPVIGDRVHRVYDF